MCVDLRNLQDSFIEDELWMLAWNASVQRASIYNKTYNENDRSEFRVSIIKYIKKEIIQNYLKKSNTEKQHYLNLQNIIDFANIKGNKVLGKNGYKAGSAQKLLNLVLKYYWCNHKAYKPPHCPIDSIVLSKLGLSSISWTKIITVDQYKDTIEEMKKKINEMFGDYDLSVWELEHYPRD